MKEFRRIINTLIITVGCAFFLLSCNDVLDFRTPKEPEQETGTFNLVIESGAASRTILPPSNGLSTATNYYNLDFTLPSGSTGVAQNVDVAASAITNPITLAVGTYNLKVTAYSDGSTKSKKIAEGTLNNITINSGSNSENIELKPISSGSGTGTFSWNISYPSPGTTTATMTITKWGESTAIATINLLDKPTDTQNLTVGYYKVELSLINATGSTGMVEILHIYENMTSGPFTYTFTDDHFIAAPAPVPVTGVSVLPTTLSLKVGGGTGSITASVTPPGATNKNVIWSITPSGVVSISETTGTETANLGPITVTAVGPGTATITATAVDGSGESGSCSVTVTQPVTTITLDPTSLTLITGGATKTIDATVGPDNASNKNITWSSSPTGIVTISSTGVVTAVSAGTTTITATAADGYGAKATCTVTVTAATTGKITITFADFDDAAPPITVPVLYKTGGSLDGTPASGVTLEANGFDIGSVSWRVNGTEVETDDEFELLADDYSVGSHSLTVKVEKGGITYNSKTIFFTVKVAPAP